MYEKRIAEIEARKAEIAKEIDTADEARVKELSAEVDKLNQEMAEIRSKQDVARKLEENPAAAKPTEEADEKRAAEVKATGRLTMSAGEVRRGLMAQQRATTLATDSLAKPTATGQTITDTFTPVSSIVDQVKVIDCEGCGQWDEPYVAANPEAGSRTDGAANASPSDPTFRVAPIKPGIINVTSYVSKNIEKLTPVAYRAKVQELALTALRAKVGKLIPNGDGANFYGIKTAKNTKGEDIFQVLEMTVTSGKGVIDEKTLRKIVMSYGGDETVGAHARLYLTKEDLMAFGDVRGSDKKAVYEITPNTDNPNTGIIKDGGLSVPYTINSGLNSLAGTAQPATTGTDVDTMLYGDPMNFELGLFGDYTIEVSKDYKFGEGLLTVMGEVMAGGNLVKHHGFLVCRLPKAAS